MDNIKKYNLYMALWFLILVGLEYFCAMLKKNNQGLEDPMGKQMWAPNYGKVNIHSIRS